MKHVQFNQVDKILLVRCADLRFTRKRTWMALALGAVVLLALVTMKVRSASIELFFWLSVGYVVLTTFDKISHGLSILAYKKLVLKLVKQISFYEKGRGGEEASPRAEEQPEGGEETTAPEEEERGGDEGGA